MKRGGELRVAPPSLSVRNAQRTVAISTAALARFGRAALARAWPLRKEGSDILRLSFIHVAIISNRRMAQLHERFCGVPGPTDVLTFQDGDVFISADKAQGNARAFHTSTDEEIRLYLVHGLLHLCGWDDITAPAARKMRGLQARLVREAAGNA